MGPDDVPTRDEVLAIIAGTRSCAIGRSWCSAHAGCASRRPSGVTTDQLDLDRRLLTVDRQLVRASTVTPAFKLPKAGEAQDDRAAVVGERWSYVATYATKARSGPIRGNDGDLLFRGHRDA